jgi:hypothetical protein
MKGPSVNMRGLLISGAAGGLQIVIFFRALAHVLKYTSLRVLKS